mmetsp:Transcript_8629/g.24853  ORF Transcript_8629/g.24853 Transcript_8629/m.24853 type:complete len:245 (+) Transcript_8629:1585-2319(+)
MRCARAPAAWCAWPCLSLLARSSISGCTASATPSTSAWMCTSSCIRACPEAASRASPYRHPGSSPARSCASSRGCSRCSNPSPSTGTYLPTMSSSTLAPRILVSPASLSSTSDWRSGPALGRASGTTPTWPGIRAIGRPRRGWRSPSASTTWRLTRTSATFANTCTAWTTTVSAFWASRCFLRSGTRPARRPCPKSVLEASWKLARLGADFGRPLSAFSKCSMCRVRCQRASTSRATCPTMPFR